MIQPILPNFPTVNIGVYFSFLDERGATGIGNPKKYLILKNSGNADCVFSVIKETEYRTPAEHRNITGEKLL